MLSKDLASPVPPPPPLRRPRPFPLRKYARARARKKKETGIAWGGCLKTGSEHKGNRTLAYALAILFPDWCT